MNEGRRNGLADQLARLEDEIDDAQARLEVAEAHKERSALNKRLFADRRLREDIRSLLAMAARVGGTEP